MTLISPICIPYELIVAGDWHDVQIEITEFEEIAPMGKWANSDADCYGWTDVRWRVLDEAGQELHLNLTRAQIEDIESLAIEAARKDILENAW
jgi:hypothetical protein